MFRCSYVESKTETGVAKVQDYIRRGHHTEKTYTGRGGHRTYFLDWVNNWGGKGGGHRTFFVDEWNNWGGTQHNIERKKNVAEF